MIRYHIQENIGKARYVVSFHDGIKKHSDGSDFYDIRIFSNKKYMNRFINLLKAQEHILKTF